MFYRREAAKFLRVLPQKVPKIYCAQLYKDLCTFSIFMHQPKNFCAPLCTGRKKIVHWRKKLCTVHKKSLTLSNAFIDFFNSLGLVQLVDKPTLGNNILDLVLCQHSDLILDLSVDEPFSTSDHNSLNFRITYGIDTADCDPLYPTRDFVKGNYNMIESYLISINWHDAFSQCANVEDFHNTFLDILTPLVIEFIPFKKPPKKYKYPMNILKLQSKNGIFGKLIP